MEVAEPLEPGEPVVEPGPRAEGGDPEAAAERADHLVGAEPVAAAEDEQAAACAVYAVLLAAESEGVASYWRTPAILNTPDGRAAVGLPDDERVLGLLHFGMQAGERPAPPERAPLESFVSFLD